MQTGDIRDEKSQGKKGREKIKEMKKKRHEKGKDG